MEIVLLGHMGRDEAAADRLVSEGHTLHVLGQWENPGLADKADANDGYFQVVESITDVETIADCVEDFGPDMFLTNFDDALAAGVVDAIRRRVDAGRLPKLWIPCPDRAAARVEWDKFYLREVIDGIDPGFNPENYMVETVEAAEAAIADFEARDIEIVLKPRNLTGGKGVKVQGKHFDSYQQAREYAGQVLAAADQTGLEVQEKLQGHEFTLQLLTDGRTMVLPPATYDYPYREDGDRGPGTGGMGAFSMKPGELLPFIDQGDYDKAAALMDRLLSALRERGLDYKGVLYPTFFKTPDGLKIVEVNARGGDPELINVLDLMDDNVNYGAVLQQIASGELTADSVRYRKLASAMVYLVSPDYGYRKGPVYNFGMDAELAAEFGCAVRFAAAERTGHDQYRSVGSSRTVGISALAETPWDARQKIEQYIAAGFDGGLPLHYRRDVGDEAYIRSLHA